MGIGFSGLSQSQNNLIDYSSITCGACHIGRVQLPDGTYQYLEGGVNTRFNLPLMRSKVSHTFELLLGKSLLDVDQTAIASATNHVLAALDEAHRSDPHYFYKNFEFGGIKFDSNYEAAQIALFKQQASVIIPKFVQRLTKEKIGYDALVEKNYATISQQMHQGIPGMADATGLSASNAYADLKNKPILGLFAPFILPNAQGVTDYMSVWEQDKRKASWTSDHKELVNGGGQWNGSVPIPIYRNIAAALTLGLENTDVRVAAFSEELLHGLPANPYPFNVDTELAGKGKILFAQHCADCHQPHNGKVYGNIGTPMGRANVVDWIIELGGRSSFYDTCSQDTAVEIMGKIVKPCEKFEGVPLAGKQALAMRPLSQQRGYNARPLSGIWAQAPYFHNGSVPTLYHVLIANERPQTFLRGIEEYDQEKLGFVWKKEDVKFTENLNTAMHFDTSVIPALNAVGHAGDITDNGKTYKLDWSDDKAGAVAILEYLKVL
ncbi:MAG: cytochrome C [Moraxellaceae bacterium]|nr:MAG: cytochrome C [Moraxellaceae bacterium]